MRRTKYEDSKGRKFLVEIPDDAPDTHAKMGVPIGPPDLAPLQLPMRVEVALNNALFDRGLYTKRELVGRRQELIGALQAALKLDVQMLDMVYEGVGGT